jgi:hypothetical protein
MLILSHFGPRINFIIQHRTLASAASNVVAKMPVETGVMCTNNIGDDREEEKRNSQNTRPRRFVFQTKIKILYAEISFAKRKQKRVKNIA